MQTAKELSQKLEQYRGLLDILVHKRKIKVLIRLLLSIPFYYFLWHLTWIRWMFWMSMPLELVMLAGTIFCYFRLNYMIRTKEIELANLN